MARAKNWAYTQLGAKDAVQLEIAGQTYPVAHLAASYALNEVPTAMCTLALGRNVHTLARATVHQTAGKLLQMQSAKITATFAGEFAASGDRWVNNRVTLFEGYYVGHSYQKINGKIQFVVHLLHWLADLGFSSCISAISHPSNPGDVVYNAVFAANPRGAGGAGKPVFIPELVGNSAIAGLLHTDLWAGIKSLLCSMAAYEGFSPRCGVPTAAWAALKVNNRAKRALARIEGPAADGCADAGVANVGYRYAKPLNLSLPLAQAYPVIVQALQNLPSVEMVHQTLWDVLIGYYCPTLMLDIVPMVDRALAICSVPAWRGPGFWRTLTPNDYDYINLDAMLPKPLRGVVVYGAHTTDTFGNASAVAREAGPCPAGLFASNSVEDGDGSILYVLPPSWIGAINVSASSAGDVTGNRTGGATNTATTANKGQAPTGKTPRDTEVLTTVNDLLNKFAQSVFIQNSLRGRSGTISGKLRFDIAPGSHLCVKGSPERFFGAEDALAATLYVQVNRVTIEINAESRRAATAMVLSHVRTETENQKDRTSMVSHPFYKGSGSGFVKGGAPLVVQPQEAATRSAPSSPAGNAAAGNNGNTVPSLVGTVD